MFCCSSGLVCYVANLLSLLHCAHWLLPLLHKPRPLSESSSTLLFLTPVSLFLFLFLCFLLYMSSHSSSTLSFLLLCFVFLLFPSFFFSLFLPSGDAAKRKAWKLNRVGSLRSIYTSLHNSEGKKLLWWTCDGQVDPHRPHPDPTHCRDGAPCTGEMNIAQ